RDNISIVGSSTVYPFSTVVAEQFGRTTKFRTPTVESTGSGGGLKLFCSGVGVQYPDITNSSRRIRASELADCAANGVDGVIEVRIGYDGIVLANDKESAQYSLSTRQIFLALARRVPAPNGSGLVDNPYTRWSEIDPTLPDVSIEVLGPPPTSGTRDAFLELVMEPGCDSFESIAALPGDEHDNVCFQMREDGSHFIEAGENDNLIVQKLQANPAQLGIFGFSFLDQNADRVQGATINGVQPTFDSIADGAYPVARPLFFYVKSAHVDSIPGVREFLREFTSDAAWGEFGYLSDKGLIPLPEDERAEVLARVRSLETITAADLTAH
ncbi:MAG: substrate-binding domain-containing protein, partial [Gammaproteobacteria bacterium]